MSVAKQVKIFSNFMKKSSKDVKTKNEVIKLSNEYERKGEQKNPDINLKLSKENIILKAFDEKEYDTYISNTDFSLNGKNTKYQDIYSTTPTIQATNFVNLCGINLTFLMSKDEWVDFYKDLSNFIKDYMGEDYRVLSEVIQFDEFTPHLQVMGIFRSEISNESLADKDIRTNENIFDEVSRKQFTRYNNKLKGTEEYTDPKNKKEYKLAKEKWIEEHREEIIKNYKPRNKTTDKKYAYVRLNNPLATTKNSYSDYQNKLYEFCKQHKFIKDLCEKATKIRGEQVSFVRNTTEPVYDGKSKNHYEIKETIERENKEIENKIKSGKDLTENEVYRYIRKQNRDKLKKDFMDLDINSWKNEFNKPQNALYDFKTKLSNDYIKIAKEIAYKPYIELEKEIETKKEELENTKIEKSNIDKRVKEINQEIEEYTNKDKWLRMDYVKKLDEKKIIENKYLNPFNKEKIVKLDIEDYNNILKMAKDNSSKLTYWQNETRSKEKEIEDLKYTISSKDNEIDDKDITISKLRDEVYDKNSEIRNLKAKHKEELEEKDEEISKLKMVFNKAIDFMKKIPYVKDIVEKLEKHLMEDSKTEREELGKDIAFYNNVISELPQNEFTRELQETNRDELIERKEELERPKHSYSYGMSR